MQTDQNDQPVETAAGEPVADAPAAATEDQFVIDDTPPVEEAPPVQETDAEVGAEIAATVAAATEGSAPAKADEKTQARKPQKVTVSSPYSAPCTWNHHSVTISMPSSFSETVLDALSKSPNVQLIDDKQSRKWGAVLNEAEQYSSFAEAFIPTMEQPDADFQQFVTAEGNEKLMGRAPVFKKTENEIIAGERACLHLLSHIGVGSLYQSPLWHSGIWVTFKPPTESEIIDFNRQLIADKIDFGRFTYGLIFSNITSYTIDRLVNFALDHVYSTTIKDIKKEDLRNLIVSQDIPSLLWGFVCTMYPNGFQYRRACVKSPESCNYVLEELLNISKLLFVNNNALTDWQKTHMTLRAANSRDLESIKRYQEEMKKMQARQVTFNKGTDAEINMKLNTPTIAQYVESGHRWIGGIVELVERSLELDATNDVRNNYIRTHAGASAMRQYAHWVEHIEFATKNIEDRDTIDDALAVLSSDDNIRTEFINAVVGYINDSTVAVVGIPAFDCPHCGAAQEGDTTLKNLATVIPLDVVNLFFAQHGQRVMRITER